MASTSNGTRRLSKAPGGARIRAPRLHKPTEAPDETWNKLRASFSEILNKNSSSLSFEEVYRQSYNIVLHKNGDKLYNGVRELVSEHLDKEAHERIEPAFPSSTSGAASASTSTAGAGESAAQAQAGERFLAAVKSVWDDHIACLSKLRDVLKYMDKVYIQQTKPPSLPTYTLGLSLFLSHVLRNDKLSVLDQLITTLLAQIRLDREGEAVNKSAVRACVEMLSLLRDKGGDEGHTVYGVVFERRFLSETRQFYQAESERLLASVSAPEYLQKVERRLQEEQARVQHYLQPSTDSLLTSLLDEVLISTPLDAVIAHTVNGLDTMLAEDRLDDLRRLYVLSGRVGPGHKRLHKAIRDWIMRRGQFICDTAVASTTGGGDGEEEAPADAKGKGRATAVAKDSAATTWVEEVLALKKKMDIQLRGPFVQDKAFEGSINEAFSDFMNGFHRSPEFLSLYLDENLKKGLKGKSEAEVDVVLNDTIAIFRHLSEKDIFEKYYKSHLARRLITGRSVSDDAERSVLAKLQLESGIAFTRDLEGMMNDVKVSTDSSGEYKNRLARTGATGMELSALICTASKWPMPSNASPCIFPPAFTGAIQSYEHFYNIKHTGRKLTWRPDMGSVDLKIRFNARSHEINVSTYGAIVLSLFEDLKDGDQLTYADIKTATGIPDVDLKRTLQSLACAKYRVLSKFPKGREINDDDNFAFNAAFTAPLARFKIQTVAARVETAKEVSETAEKIEQERKSLSEAAIVRVMKSHQTMAHGDLVNEVTRMLSHRFKPQPFMLKRVIEDLIAREYVERDAKDRKIIKYVAWLPRGFEPSRRLGSRHQAHFIALAIHSKAAASTSQPISLPSMPPKKAQKEGKPKKVVEDKTFGMKNKKGAKGQQAVQLQKQQQAQIGQNKESLAKQKAKEDANKKKLADAKHKAELEELAEVKQTVPFGVDPSTVLCQNFKNGNCSRGNKCKFSHDLNIHRKVEKADLYTDQRDEDPMSKWDDDKLKEVVLSKHGNPQTTTDIICKFFIDAVEDEKYGWRWQCPNEIDGGTCKYRHALPAGFVLKSQKKKEDEAQTTISLEEFLETERHKLGSNLTPVTKDSFAKWKQTRLDAKQAAEESERKAKAATALANKAAGLSGRDMFTFNPLLYQDEDEESDEEDGWDLAALRAAAENERDARERARIEALGGSVGTMSLNDPGPS